MALVERFQQQGYPRTQAGMNMWLADLTNEERAAVLTGVNDKHNWPAPRIMAELDEEGAPVPKLTAFKEWRNAHVAR